MTCQHFEREINTGILGGWLTEETGLGSQTGRECDVTSPPEIQITKLQASDYSTRHTFRRVRLIEPCISPGHSQAATE